MTPFFSIIIPVCNSGLSLQKTIDSISTQTFKNYEVVFIDGVSSDNTLQIISAFDHTNDAQPIKLKSEYDKGIYDAMNKGIDLATGKWLYFLGSDDIFYSDSVLAEIYCEIKKDNSDLIYGNVSGVTSKTKYVYDTLSKVLSTGIHHQSIFYKSSLLNQLGKYDLKFKIAADYHLTLKVFLNKAYIKRYVNKDIAYYGEDGFSSKNYDYPFFSSHYKILANQGGIEKIGNPKECLDKSIYCCFYLAKEKKKLRIAWSNLLYYVTHSNGETLHFRVKTLLRMLIWSFKT